MLRTCVLCCAAASAMVVAVGCNLFTDNKTALEKRDEAVKTTSHSGRKPPEWLRRQSG